MPITFDPKTDQQIAESNLLPQGNYDFEVLEAADKVSSKGNDMIELKLQVYDQQARPRIIFDYLLASMEKKFKTACLACGLDYESGHVEAADFVGKSGELKLVVQKSKDPQYADKNSVAEYVTQGSASAPKAPRDFAADLDDEILF